MESHNNFNQDTVVSTATWLLISIVLAIPFVNFIVMLFLTFGADNQNLKNFGKAGLIMIGIALVFSLLLVSCNML